MCSIPIPNASSEWTIISIYILFLTVYLTSLYVIILTVDCRDLAKYKLIPAYPLTDHNGHYISHVAVCKESL